MKINNFRGELTDISAKKEPLFTLLLCAQIFAEWEAKEHEREEARQSVKRKHGDDGDQDDDGPVFISYVPLPEQKEIELRVMQRKKQELMACFFHCFCFQI